MNSNEILVNVRPTVITTSLRGYSKPYQFQDIAAMYSHLVHLQDRFRVVSYSSNHETSLLWFVLIRYIIWTTLKGAGDGFEISAARSLDWNRPSALMETPTADRDRRNSLCREPSAGVLHSSA